MNQTAAKVLLAVSAYLLADTITAGPLSMWIAERHYRQLLARQHRRELGPVIDTTCREQQP